MSNWKKEFDEKFNNLARFEHGERDRTMPPIPSDPRKEIKAFIEEELTKMAKEEFKEGYNQCLKDQKLTGERHQNLYL